MKSPNSYTGEDIIEINCHSGLVVLNKILSVILKCGARLAEPGEFTKRAFLNGRIDLTQAESIIDIIDSKTEASLKIAAKHYQGLLADKLRGVKSGLIDIKSILETTIDFPEDENEIMSRDDLLNKYDKTAASINALISTYNEAVIYRSGIKAAIIGKPNVGKSSLLNSILADNRAIVTALPGTTRDTINETISIKGIPVNIIDTAGIGITSDEIEKIGIDKTLAIIKDADILLLVFDGSSELDNLDQKIIDGLPDKKAIAVINKSDLPHTLNNDAIKPIHNFISVVSVSALYNQGIEKLKSEIHKNIIITDFDISNDILISNMRHKTLLEKTLGSLKLVQEALNESVSPELIAVDLQAALNSLGEITGETTTEDILNNIFSRFCIGK
jgi:tRNA modification GTPase